MRIIKMLFVIAAVATPAAPQLASGQEVQSSRPATNQDVFDATLREAQAAISECRLKRLSGELPTFATSAQCSNRQLITIFNAAHYEYMDLIQYLAAKRLEVAEKIDRGELTKEQAQQEGMKIIMQITAVARERDSSTR